MNVPSLKYLPVESDGEIASHAHWVIIEYASHPDDIGQADTAVSVYRSEAKSGKYSGASEVLSASSAKQFPKMQLCGYIAMLMLALARNGETASLRKASGVVSATTNRLHTCDGKAAPNSAVPLRQLFRRSRGVIHLIAAMTYLGGSELENFLKGHKTAVEELLQLAAFFQLQFFEFGVFSDLPAENVWSVPDRFLERVRSGRFNVSQNEFPKGIADAVLEYRRFD